MSGVEERTEYIECREDRTGVDSSWHTTCNTALRWKTLSPELLLKASHFRNPTRRLQVLLKYWFKQRAVPEGHRPGELLSTAQPMGKGFIGTAQKNE